MRTTGPQRVWTVAQAKARLKNVARQSGEGEIRKNLIEAELVDCMVALPGQLFYSTQIPACLWFPGARPPAPHRRRTTASHLRRTEVLQFALSATVGYV